jgi:hypothetical protein
MLKNILVKEPIVMRKLALVFGVCFVSLVQAQDSNIVMSYRGQPVPSAIAPSMSAFSQDVCGIPVSGAVSSTVIGFSGGTVYTDANCERIKLAKTLNDLGLKVAAVATLCQDSRIWDAMMMSSFQWQFNGAGALSGGCTIVPAGSTYQLNFDGSGISNWVELY